MSDDWQDDVAIDRTIGERDAANTGERLTFEELEASVRGDDWQVVEEALNLRMVIAGRPEGDVKMAEAQIALDRLREREAQLSKANQRLGPELRTCLGRAEAAEARVAELKEIGRRMSEQVDELTEGRIQRNARMAELEEALREIAETNFPDKVRGIARRALGEK